MEFRCPATVTGPVTDSRSDPSPYPDLKPVPPSARDTIGIRDAIPHPGAALDGLVGGLRAAAGEFPAARTTRSALRPKGRHAGLLPFHGRPECRRLPGEGRG